MNIIEALHHPKLLGASFRDQGTWQPWESFLAALYGLPMTDEQAEIYRQCTGRSTPPTEQASEAFLICGRRSGKSLQMARIGCFMAFFRDWRPYLAPGERATVLLAAQDRSQAGLLKNFVAGIIDAVPAFRNEVVRETAGEIDLKNQVTIEIVARSYRGVRGRAVCCACLDEMGFWRDESSANPDKEVVDAIRPAMATIPGALLVGASSPYARRGVLWNAYKSGWGQDDVRTLIWKAGTRIMNPTVPQTFIDLQIERDPASAAAEYMAEFRSDIEGFVTVEVVDAATCFGRHELPRISGLYYRGFVDPSGGSADSMTLAIAHAEGERAVLDAVREVKPPFSPEAVVAEFAALLRSYGVSSVTGDRYAGEWPREQFRKLGVEYLVAEKPKSDLYRDLLPMLNSGKVELLDLPRLSTQLVGLERRTARGGRDSIDHAPGGHDDLANAVAGALLLASKPGGYDESLNWVGSWAQMETNHVMFGDY